MRYGAMQNVLGIQGADVFDVAARIGVEGIELDWNSPAEIDEGGPLAPGRRAAFRAAADRSGIAIPSVAAHFLNRGGLASADAAVQAAGHRAVSEGIRLCADLGAQVLLVPFFGAGAIDGAAGAERLVEHLRALAPQAQAAGVTIAIEHMLPAVEAVKLLDAVGSPAVATYWDMANGVALGYDPLAEIEALGRSIAQVHAKEYVADDRPAGTRTAPRFDRLNMRPLGQGDIPMVAILRALGRVGYDGWIMLETGSFGDPLGAAQAAIATLRAAEIASRTA